MSWSFSASSSDAREAAASISQQVKARKSEGHEKVAILAGADAIDRIAGEYPQCGMSVTFYGHADDNGISSWGLNISCSPMTVSKE